MAIKKTEAFVLKTQPLRSSSLIVTLFSRDYGKLKGVAKGVRREREVRGAFYELFTHIDLVYYEKTRSDLYLISEASIVDSFDTMRQSLETIAYGSYFVELVNGLTELYDPHPEIFNLLDVVFRYLPVMPPEKLARLFEVRLLKETGLLPDMTLPAGGGEKIFFSVIHGRVLTERELRQFPDAQSLTRETYETMKYYGSQDLLDCIKYRTTPQINESIRRMMGGFLDYHLGTYLKSRQFLQNIAPVLA